MSYSLSIEILRLTNYVLGYEAYQWRTVAPDDCKEWVMASCGSLVGTNSSHAGERQKLFTSDRPHMVVLCADRMSDEGSTKGLEVWLRQCRRHDIQIAALGTGSFVLARAGLLSQKSCAVHWEDSPGFTESFLDVDVVAGIYHVDNGIWTCGGGSASLDMMLHLVRTDLGEAIVEKVCEQALVDRGRSAAERQRVPFAPKRRFLNDIVVDLICEMERRTADVVSMDELASAIRRSRRQIERLFRREVGCSPSRYYRELRLERARLLLSDSKLAIVEIALDCGFGSASHFTKCFRQRHGVAPHEVRRSRLRPQDVT